MDNNQADPTRRLTREPIVITGAGLVTCLGLNVKSTWSRVVRGESGIGPLTAVESSLPSQMTGGQAEDLPNEEREAHPREVAYLRRALDEALRQEGLLTTLSYDPFRCGIILGTTLHGMRRAGSFLRNGNAGELSGFLAGSTLNQAVLGFGLSGLSMTLCSACSSGLASISAGVSLLQAGLLDLAVAGGYDPLSEYAFGGFRGMRLLSDGELRPFARTRDGMKLGEGYAVVVLERASDAAARNARVLAEILGFGETCDAYHLSKPNPSGAGAVRAIQRGLKTAGLTAANIDLIAAHATATAENDAAEFTALATAFGDSLSSLPVVAFKSHVGHTLGGAGAVELILALCAMQDQIIPPSANSTPEDLAFGGLRLATGDGRRAPIRRTLNVSLGFGGSNTCMILGRSAPPTPSTRPSFQRFDVVVSGIGVVLPGITGISALGELVTTGAQGVAAPVGDGGGSGRRITNGTLEEDTGALSCDALDALLVARRARRLSDYVKLTLAAATLAFQDAKIEDIEEFGEDCHAVLGTTHGSTAFSERYYRQIIEEGLDAANPILFAEGVPNAAAAHLSTSFGIKGFCLTAIGTRTAGLEALLLATARIRLGEWTHAIVSAADEYGQLVNETYRRQGLYRGGADTPVRRRWPGFVTGCGAVTFILERGDVAARRGAKPRGVLEGTAAGHFPSPRQGSAIVENVWTTLGRPGSVILSANETWIDRIEQAGLRRGRVGPSVTAAIVSTIYGHVAECFSAGPLTGLAAVLARGRLPAWRIGKNQGMVPAKGDERVDRFGVLATDYAGAVVGIGARYLPHNSS